jgi:hypothetical protein
MSYYSGYAPELTDYRPSCEINNELYQLSGAKTPHEYRMWLQNNAKTIATMNAQKIMKSLRDMNKYSAPQKFM